VKKVLTGIIAIVLLLTIPVSAADAPQLTGHWSGAIELPGTRLEIDCDFTSQADGSWAGDISIPAQNAKDLPLAAIKLQGNEASFQISGIPGDPAFKGSFSADGAIISGSFVQGGQTFTFQLNRGDSPAAKAKTALASMPSWPRGCRD
jgi:hypothetical protein